MISTFALHPSASKYLIARAVANLPEVQNALQNGKIFLSNGTGNSIIAEEMLKIKVDPPESHVAGVITQGAACVTSADAREQPWCIEKGRVVDKDWLDFIKSFGPGDVFIKGANALDPDGNVGILMGDPQGGSIGQTLGILKARGIPIIVPVGLEKLILSCPAAGKNLGIFQTGPRLGLAVGYMVVSGAKVITEIESIRMLFDLPCTQIAAGGVGGMEGSVVLAASSDDESKLLALVDFVKRANRRKPINIKRNKCTQCPAPCRMVDRG